VPFRPSHLALIATLAAVPAAVRAEGSAQLGGNGRVQVATPLRIDIVDASTERIRWQGQGTLRVEAPDGTLVTAALANNASTGSLAAFGPGAYRLTLSANQNGTQNNANLPGNASFDIAVVDSGGAVVADGRLFSTAWNFLLGDRGAVRALDHSFFALVPGGAADRDAVVEVDFEGLNGNSHTFSMNSTGVDGRSDGRSSPSSANSFTPEFPLYLNPPALRRGGTLTPTVDDLTFGSEEDGLACSLAAAGVGGVFAFQTDVVGTGHVVCDLDGDGVASLVDPDDLSLRTTTTPGNNTLAWNGRTNGGAVVPDDTYRCEAFVVVGELHFLGLDVETSFPGLRMYDVADDGSTRTPLRMFWDDSLLPSADVDMSTGEPGLVTSGPEGMLPNAQQLDPVPNVTGRAWGNFNSGGKRGNNELTDTWTFARASTRRSLELRVVDGAIDTDGDGLTDVRESCEVGTDPDDADTDDDGVADGDEPSLALDSDGDGAINALDPDSDNDGLFDGTELGISSPDPDTDVGAGFFVADADPVSTTDPLDPDSDDGGLGDGVEDVDGNGRVDAGEGDPELGADDDTVDLDGDGLGEAEERRIGTDPRDADSDDDGVSDGDEPAFDEDTDGDGRINALDPDSDGDGLKDGTELGVTTPDDDTDVGAGDFVPDADPATTTDPLDPDSDDGSVQDGVEDANRNGRVDAGETDPRDTPDDVVGPDGDDDGIPDQTETDREQTRTTPTATTTACAMATRATSEKTPTATASSTRSTRTAMTMDCSTAPSAVSPSKTSTKTPTPPPAASSRTPTPTPPPIPWMPTATTAASLTATRTPTAMAVSTMASATPPWGRTMSRQTATETASTTTSSVRAAPIPTTATPTTTASPMVSRTATAMASSTATRPTPGNAIATVMV